MGRCAGWRQKASAIESFLLANGVMYTVVLVYIVGNLLLFLHSADKEYARHKDFQRYTTSIARGCGAILNFNLAVVLLSASRSLVAFLRETPLAIILPIDALMPGAHAIIGSIIVIAGAIHTVAHLVTFALKRPWSSGYSGYTSLFVTGIGICITFVIVRLSALNMFRRQRYEMFRSCHVGGGAVAYILLCIHGLHLGVPSTWKWILGPCIIYTVDYALRVMREKRSYLFVNKHSAVFQGQSVLRLRLPRVFHFQAGQYAELKVPAISKSQWHPFTIASAPHEAEMVFYVKAAGNWTTALFQLFADRLREERGAGDDIEVHIRGPFAAPATKFDQFEHLILVGGGVGATPFCSVVKSLHYWIVHWSPQAAQDDSLSQADDKSSLDNTRGVMSRADKKEHLSSAKRSTNKMKSSGRLRTSWRLSSSSSHDLSSSTRDHTAPMSFYTAYTHPADADTTTSHSTMNSGIMIHEEQNKSIVSKEMAMTAASKSKGEDTSIATTQHAKARSLGWAASIRSDRDVLARTAAGPRETGEVWEQLSHGSGRRSIGPWTAMNSLYGDLDMTVNGNSRTYQESLNMMIGLSYGAIALARGMQMQKARRTGGDFGFGKVGETSKLHQDPLSVPPAACQSAISADTDLSIFYDWRFLALVYAKSVTVNLALMWILILRAFIAGFATLFNEVSLLHNGLTVYKSTALLAVDTVLATAIALGVGLPALLEVHELGAAPVSWLDLTALTPAAVFGVVTNALAMAGVGRDVNLFGILTIVVVWPVTALLFLARLVRVVGERMTLGKRSLQAHGEIQSVDFYWTAATQEDDGWLVEELLPCAYSKHTRLHRYITRAQPRDEEWMERLEPGTAPPFSTEYRRPDWDEIFNEVAERARNGSTIGVFLCGPTPMAKQVEEAAMKAMRNSIVRGLQSGANPMRSLEEVFGNSITANAYTGDNLDGCESQDLGINVTFVVSVERFS
jgi:NAD(P)H-flavin reductase